MYLVIECLSVDRNASVFTGVMLTHLYEGTCLHTFSNCGLQAIAKMQPHSLRCLLGIALQQGLHNGLVLGQ